MWTYLISGAVYGFAAGALPGPALAYLISLTLKHGIRRSLPVVVAPLLSDGFIVFMTLLVLTRVPPALVQWLQIAGGAFLLYLARGAYGAWRENRPAMSDAVQSMRMDMVKATVVNLLNPNPYLGWSLVLGPMVVRAWRESHSRAAAVPLGFYGAWLGTTITILLIFDFTRGRGPQIARALIGLSAVALGCFGVLQLWLALRAA